MSHRLPFLALLAAAFTLIAGSAWARCSQNVAGLERLGIRVASLEGLPFAAGNSPSRAIITFLGHSSYQIDTPQGVRAITDYNGVNGFGRKPDIVTMNNAHSTHFTDDPEEGIAYVLRGWPSKPGESEAKYDVQLKDMKVWNVPTNARDWGSTAARINGNSIFIYAIADLCIAHLGHLHHRLTREHLTALGEIDVLMVPVDGSYTLDLEDMIEVIEQIHAPLVIPMHFFSMGGLQRFLEQLKGTNTKMNYAVEFSPVPSVMVSRESLPRRPQILVLPGH